MRTLVGRVILGQKVKHWGDGHLHGEGEGVGAGTWLSGWMAPTWEGCW